MGNVGETTAEERKRRRIEQRRQRKYEAAIRNYEGVGGQRSQQQQQPQKQKQPTPTPAPVVRLKTTTTAKKKRVRRVEPWPHTEAAVIEMLASKTRGSALWPETDETLVELTVFKFADDDDELSVPVLDLGA